MVIQIHNPMKRTKPYSHQTGYNPEKRGHPGRFCRIRGSQRSDNVPTNISKDVLGLNAIIRAPNCTTPSRGKKWISESYSSPLDWT
ncbi:hypothetical protein JTB14_022835 [Gonioctena quinquepunctata]|nr:hypothetical protein JTB14_022835 [Gonioctena quinquepunctata]